MLKVILWVLFMTGFCMCVERPFTENVSKRYNDLVAKGHPCVDFKYENEKALQNVEVTTHGGTGVHFTIKEKQAKGQVFFRHSMDKYILSWFAYDCENGRFHFRFTTDEEAPLLKQFTVYTEVFSKPPPSFLRLAQNLRLAQQEAFHVQLVPPKTLKDLLERTGSGSNKIDINLSIAWIKNFFGMGKPVSVPKDLDDVLLARALTMDEEDLKQLAGVAHNLNLLVLPSS